MPVDAGNSTHFAVGPVIAIVMVILLAMVAKWVFSTGSRRSAVLAAREGTPGDHGLLRPVAEPADRPSALALRAVLSDAGIRSTLGVRRDGRVQVLVFPDDEERARLLVPPG